MKADAIVFTSNTGFTAEYARMLGNKTSLPVYSLTDAAKSLAQGSRILYLGWLMAGKVQGYNKASGKYKISAVCGVGMGASGTQISDVRKANAISGSMPVFTLQGGFEMEKLSGIYKFMMKTIKKTMGKKLADKKDRTADENDMLDLIMNGGSRVSESNLGEVLDWLESE